MPKKYRQTFDVTSSRVTALARQRRTIQPKKPESTTIGRSVPSAAGPDYQPDAQTDTARRPGANSALAMPSLFWLKRLSNGLATYVTPGDAVSGLPIRSRRDADASSSRHPDADGARKKRLISLAKSWLGREDSNLRMVESKSTALPLGDAPISCLESGGTSLPRIPSGNAGL
jgi:hypothetical protein